MCAFSGLGPLLDTGDAAVRKTVSVPIHMILPPTQDDRAGHLIIMVLRAAEKNTGQDPYDLSRPLASLKKGQLNQHLQASKKQAR